MALIVGSIVSIGFSNFGAMSASATPASKAFVCKYVGTPGTNETLQTGNNPISVSGNAISGWDGVTIPFAFNDAQGKSVVIAIDSGQPEPDVSQCPSPVTPPPTDVCSNIDGVQTTVPEGLVLNGTECVTPPPTDVCSNIDGVQTTVPEGLVLNGTECVTPPPTCSVTAPTPLTASWVKQYADVVWTTNTGHFTATLKEGVNLCGSVTILVSGYAVPSTWDGNGFNSTATPQQLVGTTKQIVLTNDVRTGEATADIPTCGNVQVDGYTPPEIVTVTPAGHGNQFIAGGLWHISNCAPPTDVCSNIDGVQTTVPEGLVLNGTECVTPPQVCTVTGSSYTEDGYPLFTADGQEYQGGSGHALNWLVPVSGNLQGFTTASFTITEQSGYHVGYRFVLFSTGTAGYTSVTAEPYMNGWVAGQTGTFTITPATLVWNSHIYSGPGSQSSPVSITDMAALIPANQLISVGTHQGSNAAEGQYSVVSKITGCATFDKPVKPESATTTTQASNFVCTADSNPAAGTVTTVTTTWSQPYIWDTQSGAYVIDTNPAHWTKVSDNSPGVTRAATSEELITNKCSATIPKDASASVSIGTAQTCTASSSATSTVTFAKLVTVDGKPATVLDQTVGNHTAGYASVEGHLFADGTAVASKDYVNVAHTASQSTDSSAPCYVKPPNVLAFTGVAAVVGTVTAALALLLLGFLLFFLPRLRRRNSGEMV